METRNLIISISSLCNVKYEDFTSKERFNEFLINYKEIQESLRLYIVDHKSDYLSKKLKEMPVITDTEFKDPNSLLNFIMSSPIFDFLQFLFGMNRRQKLKAKLGHVSSLCSSLVHVLKNPGMEELIAASGNYKS